MTCQQMYYLYLFSCASLLLQFTLCHLAVYRLTAFATMTHAITWVESLLVLWHPAPGISGGKLSTTSSPDSFAQQTLKLACEFTDSQCPLLHHFYWIECCHKAAAKFIMAPVSLPFMANTSCPLLIAQFFWHLQCTIIMVLQQ